MNLATPTELAAELPFADFSRLESHAGNPAQLLQELVDLVQARLQVDACSIYLLEPDRTTLVLAATVGLNQTCVGEVRMSVREGLVGIAAERLEPFSTSEAATHPRYKYFPDLAEDHFHSFLCVPIIDRGLLQGVLTIQTRESRIFSEAETQALVGVARQFAPVIGEARGLEQFIRRRGGGGAKMGDAKAPRREGAKTGGR